MMVHTTYSILSFFTFISVCQNELMTYNDVAALLCAYCLWNYLFFFIIIIRIKSQVALFNTKEYLERKKKGLLSNKQRNLIKLKIKIFL